MSPSRIVKSPLRRSWLRVSRSLLSAVRLAFLPVSSSFLPVSSEFWPCSAVLAEESELFCCPSWSFCATSASLRCMSSAFASSRRRLPSCRRCDSASSSCCCALSVSTSLRDWSSASFASCCCCCAACRSSVAWLRLACVVFIFWLSFSMPKSAVRTFCEAAAMTPKVRVVMHTPVKIVTIMDVCRGRRPKIDSFFLPTFEPRRSPMKAMAPPVMMSTTMSRTPYILYLPPFLDLGA